jgi:hypothetical protein
MFKINVKKLEKKIEKRLNKGYRSNCYCIIEKEITHYEGSGIVEYKELTIRAGYPIEVDDEKTIPSFQQVHFTFMVNEELIRNANELASVFAVYITSRLDEFDYFTKEK